jgi:hypothetical protein
MFKLVFERIFEWIFFKRLGKCFERIKREHHMLGFYRFYLVTKCPDLLSINPDVNLIALLFHLHNSTVDFDEHIVIYFLRSLLRA